MKDEQLQMRTKQFALRVIRLTESLPDTRLGRTLANQLLKAGTSVGANYRAASRAKSVADFIHKMGIVEEEADESMFWMEILVESGLIEQALIDNLYREADEIVAMVVSSIRTARNNK